jgi:hypothetical protein
MERTAELELEERSRWEQRVLVEPQPVDHERGVLLGVQR